MTKTTSLGKMGFAKAVTRAHKNVKIDMQTAKLLIEIGCEELPAKQIQLIHTALFDSFVLSNTALNPYVLLELSVTVYESLV